MLKFNIADAAKGMDDSELAASIAAMSAEQMRRAAIPESERPDPRIKAMLEKRHADMYGANPRAVQIAADHHRKHFG